MWIILGGEHVELTGSFEGMNVNCEIMVVCYVNLWSDAICNEYKLICLCCCLTEFNLKYPIQSCNKIILQCLTYYCFLFDFLKLIIIKINYDYSDIWSSTVTVEKLCQIFWLFIFHISYTNNSNTKFVYCRNYLC
jgi:hypothetical protein